MTEANPHPRDALIDHIGDMMEHTGHQAARVFVAVAEEIARHHYAVLTNGDVVHTGDDEWSAAGDVERIVGVLRNLGYATVHWDPEIPVPEQVQERFGTRACRLRLTGNGRALLDDVQQTP
jgi:hypothetical protein